MKFFTRKEIELPRRFSFLKSKHAREEIRKHQWIESEKQGKEIGFPTAALDWINKHGQSWKDFYIGENCNS